MMPFLLIIFPLGWVSEVIREYEFPTTQTQRLGDAFIRLLWFRFPTQQWNMYLHADEEYRYEKQKKHNDFIDIMLNKRWWTCMLNISLKALADFYIIIHNFPHNQLSSICFFFFFIKSKYIICYYFTFHMYIDLKSHIWMCIWGVDCEAKSRTKSRVVNKAPKRC